VAPSEFEAQGSFYFPSSARRSKMTTHGFSPCPAPRRISQGLGQGAPSWGLSQAGEASLSPDPFKPNRSSSRTRSSASSLDLYELRSLIPFPPGGMLKSVSRHAFRCQENALAER
jgi:hypothetical protein